MSRALARSSSSSILMAAAGAWRSAVGGNSVLAGAVAFGDFDAFDFGEATMTPSPGASRQPFPEGEASAGAGGSTWDFSVMINCFFGVFSFLSASALAAFAAFRSAQRSVITDTKLKRGFKNTIADEKENFVARKSETRNEARRTTIVPAGFNACCRFSASMVPNSPPAGM